MNRGFILPLLFLILAISLIAGIVSAESDFGMNTSYATSNESEPLENLTSYQDPVELQKALKEWNDKGYAAFKRGDFENAVDAYQEALLISPNNSLSLLYLADSLFYLNDYETSLTVYEQALNTSDDEHQIDIAHAGIVKTKKKLEIS